MPAFPEVIILEEWVVMAGIKTDDERRVCGCVLMDASLLPFQSHGEEGDPTRQVRRVLHCVAALRPLPREACVTLGCCFLNVSVRLMSHWSDPGLSSITLNFRVRGRLGREKPT